MSRRYSKITKLYLDILQDKSVSETYYFNAGWGDSLKFVKADIDSSINYVQQEQIIEAMPYLTNIQQLSLYYEGYKILLRNKIKFRNLVYISLRYCIVTMKLIAIM